jgi:signal transduction histidine kinase
MSHDFRTPLSTINTSTYLLERTDDPATRSKRLQVIGQQVVRLEKLLEGLLTMTQLDQGIELKLAPVDVSELVRQIGPRAQLAAEARAQVVAVEVGSPCRISADVIKLDQAVMHIVQNAIQYSADGGLITLAAGSTGSRAFIEVRDRGIGIDASDLPHIFERFYRADRARGSETGGIGLGLAIARRIVELHGGSIEVESAPNQGSTFRILLPPA